jgi:hypothetical protein
LAQKGIGGEKRSEVAELREVVRQELVEHEEECLELPGLGEATGFCRRIKAAPADSVVSTAGNPEAL